MELHHRIMDKVKQELEAFEERIAQRSSIDEKAIRSLVKAMVGSEAARLHSIIMEEIARVRSEVEKKLSKLGVDADMVRRIVDEVYSKLLNDIRQLLDQRIMHIAQIIKEKSNDVKDVLDLVNEVLKLEVEFEEKIEELRSMLSEEALEEHLYRALIKHGIIRRRKRRWVPLIAGLSVLAAIIAGFIINPIVTFVILAIVLVILLRW